MVENDDDLKVLKKSLDGKGIITTPKKKTKTLCLYVFMSTKRGHGGQVLIVIRVRSPPVPYRVGRGRERSTAAIFPCFL